MKTQRRRPFREGVSPSRRYGFAEFASYSTRSRIGLAMTKLSEAQRRRIENGENAVEVIMDALQRERGQGQAP